MRYNFTLFRIAKIQMTESNKCWWGCVNVNYTATTTVEQNMGILKSKKKRTKNRLSIWFNSAIWHKQKWHNHVLSKRYCTSMFIIALFIIPRICSVSRYSSSDERIKKMWYKNKWQQFKYLWGLSFLALII